MSSVEDRNPSEVHRLLSVRTGQLAEHAQEDTMTFTVAATDAAPPTYLTLDQAAERAGRSRMTILRWIRAGKLQELYAGTSRRVAAEELEALLEDRPQRPLTRAEVIAIPPELRAEVLARFHTCIRRASQALDRLSEPVRNYLHLISELAELPPDAPQILDLFAVAAATLPPEQRRDADRLLRALWPFEFRAVATIGGRQISKSILPGPSDLVDTDDPEQNLAFERILSALLEADGALQALSVSRDSHVLIPTAQALWILNDAIHRGKRALGWDDQRGTGVPTYTSRTNRNKDGAVHISVRDLDGLAEPREGALPALWQTVHQFDDLTSDALIACFAFWCARATAPDEHLWISLDSILDLRGVERKHNQDQRQGNLKKWSGGHREEDRADLARRLQQLDQTWIELRDVEVQRGRGRRRAQRLTIESKAIELRLRARQFHLDGSRSVQAVQFGPGAWAREYWGADLRWRGLLAQKALEYHLERQQPEKRLAKYLAFHFRIDAHAGRDALRRTVATLVDVAGINVAVDHPERNLRKRLESALDQLKKDGIIKDWRYPPADELPARKWVTTWLDWVVDLTPSDYVSEHYVRAGVRPALPTAGDSTHGNDSA
jgi:excisionase family DNA binding protein